jgi:hypothetical protein
MSKKKGDSQDIIKAAALFIQDMAQTFEEFACDCVFHNGHGGCKRNVDGCTAMSCPLPSDD